MFSAAAARLSGQRPGMDRKTIVRPPFLVAIVGGSGSGKTWLAERLASELSPNAVRVSLDDFYRDRSHLPRTRRARINFDQPRAIDWIAFESALHRLALGRSARIPQYDFKTHSRLRTWKTLLPKPVILIDGLWLLRRRSSRFLFQMRIFLECPVRIRLQRRLERDVGLRGRTAASVRRQFRETVDPMHRLHVVAQRRYADVVMRGTCSPGDIKRLAQQIRRGIRPN
jgi:uridine kinase